MSLLLKQHAPGAVCGKYEILLGPQANTRPAPTHVQPALALTMLPVRPRTRRSAQVHYAAAFVQEVELAVELDELEGGARAKPARAAALFHIVAFGSNTPTRASCAQKVRKAAFSCIRIKCSRPCCSPDFLCVHVYMTTSH